MNSRFIPTRVGYTYHDFAFPVPISGSSPLAWGIRSGASVLSTEISVHPHSRGVYIARMIMKPSSIRFIPTRVGYTAGMTQREVAEKRFIPTRVGYTLCNFDFFCCMVRFIPTRVGYTAQLQFLDFPDTVHPHSRGVYKQIFHCLVAVGGSSPLAWGILTSFADHRRRKYGSSPLAWGILLQRHPAKHSTVGSSPLAWGILSLHLPMHLLIRFIPTRVGYTSKFQHSERFRPVHPHSRGVYAARKLDFWEAFGSSPLAWGIPWNAAQKQGKTFGSSPLAWGIRSAVLTSTSEFAVHPHSRGVYSAIPVICFNRYTVHPHSRGVYIIEVSPFHTQ